MTSWNDADFAATDSETDPFIIINYAKEGYDSDLLYLKDLLSRKSAAEPLDARGRGRITTFPTLLIHPDYLIDISSLAACFSGVRAPPLNYFMNKNQAEANTAPSLMGNRPASFSMTISTAPQEPVSYPTPSEILCRFGPRFLYLPSSCRFSRTGTGADDEHPLVCSRRAALPTYGTSTEEYLLKPPSFCELGLQGTCGHDAERLRYSSNRRPESATNTIAAMETISFR